MNVLIFNWGKSTSDKVFSRFIQQRVIYWIYSPKIRKLPFEFRFIQSIQLHALVHWLLSQYIINKYGHIQIGK